MQWGENPPWFERAKELTRELFAAWLELDPDPQPEAQALFENTLGHVLEEIRGDDSELGPVLDRTAYVLIAFTHLTGYAMNIARDWPREEGVPLSTVYRQILEAIAAIQSEEPGKGGHSS